MIDLGDLVVLTLATLAAIHFWRGYGVREVALAATRRYCREHGLQLLDDSVALRALWFKRNPRGALCLWRAYYFEFASTGDERYPGKTVTLGKIVESIQVAPHRLPDKEKTLH